MVANKKRVLRCRTMKTSQRSLIGISFLIGPICVVLFCFKVLAPMLVNNMSSTKAGELTVMNSAMTIKLVISPFASIVMFVLSVLLSVLLLYVISKVCERYGWETEGIDKHILLVEIIVIILTVIPVIYASSIGFQYWEYGVKIDDASRNIIALSPIPNVYSDGVSSKDDTSLYKVGLILARACEKFYKNLDMGISYFGSVLISLKVVGALFIKRGRAVK